jgi:ketosteroid isomerase-like protein
VSQENVDVVRRALGALVREDMQAVVLDFDADVEIYDFDIPDADVYRGPDGFFKWLGVWGESWESWRFEGLEILPAGEEHVVALFQMFARGRGSGVEIGRRDGVAYTLRNGKIVRMEYYNDQQRAREAVGLAE